MWILVRRLVPSALALCLLATLLWGPAFSKEVPLQAPIFRSWRLDFAPLLVPYPGHPEGTVLPIQYAQVANAAGDGERELLVFNDPCLAGPGGVFRIRLTQGGVIESVSGTSESADCHEYHPPHSEMFASGDFDGNGMLDFASWDSGRLFLRSPGGAVQTRPLSFSLDPSDGYAVGDHYASADLNGDGIPDVVIAREYLLFDPPYPVEGVIGADVYVFLADGHGGFFRSQKIHAPVGPTGQLLEPQLLAELTGDGVPDYLMCESSGQHVCVILPGDGKGHLAPPEQGIPVSNLSDGDLSSAQRMAIGDLNTDGIVDLVLAHGAAVQLFLSSGVGQFQSAPLPYQPPITPSYYSWDSISIQDVDGDGRQDLQLVLGTASVLYPGIIGGSFGPPQLSQFPFSIKGSLRAKWNEDSLPDEIYYGIPSAYSYLLDPWSLSVFLADAGASRDQIDLAPPWSGAFPRAVADFDDDGEEDLLFAGQPAGSPARIVVYRGDGHGDFQPMPEAEVPPGWTIQNAVAADFNHDGRDDAAVLMTSSQAGGPGEVALYLGQPSGTPLALSLTRPAGPAPVAAAAADLDGDGNLDLLVADKGRDGGSSCYHCVLGGTVSVYPGQAGGLLGDPVKVIDTDPPGWYPGIADIQVGRVNGDAIPDLLILFNSFVSDGHGSDATWADGLGDGRFGPPYLFQNNLNPARYPLIPPADLNGDGRPDLGMSPVYLRYSSPPFDRPFGTFLGHDEENLSQFGISSSCCQDPGRFIDLDGDGFLDLTGPGTGFYQLLFGAGTGTGNFETRGPGYAPSEVPMLWYGFTSPPVVPPPLFGDFNDDGREDVEVWDSQAIHLLLNRSNRVASDPAESLLEAPSGGHSVDPVIDLAEIQARVGSYDFSGSGTPQGALVFTLSLNDRTEATPGVASGDVTAILDGSARAGGTLRPGGGRPGPAPLQVHSTDRPHMKEGRFQLFLNFGEALKDSDGDGTLDLSLANAFQEPGLAGIPLADVSLNLRLDGGGPPFTGLHDIGRFSTVDRERGIATFVVPFQDLLATLTPAERTAMDQGDGTGRLFLWAVSRLYGDQDRVPDTDDGGDPTIRSEVREFRFPLKDLRVAPALTFGDVLLTSHLDGPLTFANHGVVPATVEGTDLPSGALSLLPDLPLTVPPASRAPTTLRYAPTQHETFRGTLQLGSDDPEGPALSLYLSGRGVAPIASVSPDLLDFGSAPVGIPALSSHSFQVHNAGDADLHITWSLQDPYAQFSFYSRYHYVPDARSFAVGPNQSQNIYLYFIPTQTGPSDSFFEMETDDPFQPHLEVTLHGLGTPPEPRISIGSGCFGSTISGVPLGGEGNRTCSVTNTGSAPLEILSVTSSRPDFTAGVEPTTISPGESGTLTVTYRPTEYGTFVTEISVASNDPTHPTISNSVYGKAYQAPPQAQISQTLLDFGDVHQGDTSTLSFDIANTGGKPLDLTGSTPLLGAGCAFQTDLTVPREILPGEMLTVHVTYYADIDKTLCGSLRFYTNDAALSSVTITLQVHLLSPLIAIYPASVSFPTTMVGSSSTTIVEIQNHGQDVLRITQAAFGQPVFSLSGDLPPDIPVGESAVLQLVFHPSAIGLFSSYVDLATNDLAHRTVRISLTGWGDVAFSATPRIGIKE